MGLTELLVNAVEHGNLGITYAEKKNLRLNGGWEEEIIRRRALPECRDRRVIVTLERTPEAFKFSVTDEGKGFDTTKFLARAEEVSALEHTRSRRSNEARPGGLGVVAQHLEIAAGATRDAHGVTIAPDGICGVRTIRRQRDRPGELALGRRAGRFVDSRGSRVSGSRDLGAAESRREEPSLAHACKIHDAMASAQEIGTMKTIPIVLVLLGFIGG